MKDFNEDFKFFIDLIKSEDSFAYARYADGEVALMQGRAIGVGSQAFHVDNWMAPNDITKAGKDLLQTLNHVEDNYYYAISSKSDQITDHEFLTSRIKSKNITYANLWINANYEKMKTFYENLSKEVYVICNEKAKKQSFPFTVSELFPFPNDCITYWEKWGEDYISQLAEYVAHLKNRTFFISCGPISEIIIHRLYEINSQNQYIDVGSSIDEFVHGYKTRPYMDPNSFYAKQISTFND